MVKLVAWQRRLATGFYVIARPSQKNPAQKRDSAKSAPEGRGSGVRMRVEQREDGIKEWLCRFASRRNGKFRTAISRRPHRHPFRPQSSSASRLTAGASGFFILSQSAERPER
jgi:hypothetical protein